MAKWPGYQRFCSLARGLDLIGERWTLLIVQEISFGAIRYNELRRRLPGIGSNILADRLRKLETHNIVRRVPAAVGQGVLYELTSRGEGLAPAIVELRKWGLDEQLMLDTPPDLATHELSYGVPEGANLGETYQWDIDGASTTLVIDGTTLTQRPGPATSPAVTVTTTKAWMTELVAGNTNWIEGRTSGAVGVEGSDDAWHRMLIATAQPGADITLLDQDEPRSSN
ncbi:MAG: helix-turn-helix transcriptional regulator [Ilumatobacteraceae bacterium]|nr:helix-turn-helix transcriptional regulator [Ilumatobacteraceae bacterium]